MNGHLSDEQLIGYSHATLTDAEREAMDSHLTDCPHCRARLSEHEGLQQRVRHDLLADLRTARPPAGLTFSAIAPHLKRPNSLAELWRRSGQLVPSAMALAALTGLVIALIGLVKGGSWPATDITPAHPVPLPTVACFLFAIPVIGNYYESRVVPSRLILSGVVAFILWVGTAIVGLYEMFLVREMLFRIYAQTSFTGLRRDYWRALALGNWALIPLALVWIALVVGGGEYHYKRAGQRSSWRLFGWTLAAELFILMLPLLV
ncbi:MAG: hypothetical protein U9R15_14240 [Chloroflexota bacterium]|nr:hypothetical protein [Chloroflexota bacterium]